ncbi:MAG: DUF768 domain-containing protein [Bauldia sp.]|jgi:hypothetical protein
MSKRFRIWVETWVEQNVVPGAHVDVESHAAAANRLSERLFAEGAAAGFSKFEIDEERKGAQRLVRTVATSGDAFDIDSYHLAWQLAMEHPDGD